MTKTIGLNNEQEAILDDEDYEALKSYHWYSDRGYATRMSLKGEGKRRMIRMHQQILNIPNHLVADHINGNRLDNRRANLRICTRAQNNMNRFVEKQSSSSIYKGVCWRPHANAWKAYIKLNSKQMHLGYFQSEEEAALAYNAAAREHFGQFARLNEVTS